MAAGALKSPAASEEEEEECDPQRSVVPSPGLQGLLHKGWSGVTGQWARSFGSALAPAGTVLNL